MRELSITADGCESLGSKQRHHHPATEGNIQSRQRQNDETSCRQPMGEAIQAGETRDRLAREAMIDADLAADHIEQNQRRNHAENGDRSNRRQLLLVEVTPVLTLRLNERRSLRIGNGDTSRKRVTAFESLEQSIFAHRFAGRVEIIVLRSCREHGASENNRQRSCERFDPCAHRTTFRMQKNQIAAGSL